MHRCTVLGMSDEQHPFRTPVGGKNLPEEAAGNDPYGAQRRPDRGQRGNELACGKRGTADPHLLPEGQSGCYGNARDKTSSVVPGVAAPVGTGYQKPEKEGDSEPPPPQVSGWQPRVHDPTEGRSRRPGANRIEGQPQSNERSKVARHQRGDTRGIPKEVTPNSLGSASLEGDTP